MPASLLFGLLWDRIGSRAAFDLGASLALLAALLMLVLPANRQDIGAQSVQ